MKIWYFRQGLRARRRPSEGPHLPRPSLRRQFMTLALGLSVGATILLLGDFLWQRQMFLNEIQAHICEEARIIATALDQTASLEEEQAYADFLLRLLDDLDHYPVTHELYLLDLSGQVLFERGVDESSWSGLTPPMRQVLAGQTSRAFEIMWHGDHLVASCSVMGSASLIHLSEPVPLLEAYWRYLIGHRLALAGLITLILLGFTQLALARWIFLPLHNLLESLHLIRLGIPQFAVPKGVAREWQEIAGAIERSFQAVHQSRQALAEERSRLAFLYRANHLLAEAGDWPLLVRIALQLAMEAAETRSGLFLHRDPLTGRMSLELGEGIPPLALEAIRIYMPMMEDATPCRVCHSRSGRLRLGCALLPPELQPEGPGTWLCMDLAYGDQLLGMLLLRQEPAILTQAERWALLEALAGEISAAVAAAHHARWEASVMVEIDRLAGQGRIHHKALVRLVQQLTRACGMTSGALLVWEAQSGFPELLAHWGWPSGFIPALLQAAWAFMKPNNHRFPSPDPLYRTDLGWLHWIPIRLGEKQIGGFLFAHPAQSRMMPSQRRLAQVVAVQTALLLLSLRRERRLIEAVLWEERRRLARELHDGLAQQLAYLHLRIQKIERMVDSRIPDEAIARSLRETREALRDLYTEVRLTIEGFQAPRGTDPADSLRQMIAPYVTREVFSIALELEAFPALSPWEEAHLLHIVQEALNNIRRHAQAHHVTIRTLWQGGTFILAVIDDGRGFDPEAVPATSAGLNIMRERAARIGGRLQIVSEPGRGTRVELQLPGRTPAIRGGVDVSDHPADRR